MRDEETLEALMEVTAQMLEDAAFIFSEPMEGCGPFEGEAMEAKIGFEGPRKGMIVLIFDKSLASVFAANFLGVEPDDLEAMGKGRDAAGEMLNIIAGALMERIFGDEIVVNLGIPEVQYLENPHNENVNYEDCIKVSFMTDEDQRIDVHLIFL
jgi:CheY-specific phosphatase CheX